MNKYFWIFFPLCELLVIIINIITLIVKVIALIIIFIYLHVDVCVCYDIFLQWPTLLFIKLFNWIRSAFPAICTWCVQFTYYFRSKERRKRKWGVTFNTAGLISKQKSFLYSHCTTICTDVEKLKKKRWFRVRQRSNKRKPFPLNFNRRGWV